MNPFRLIFPFELRQWVFARLRSSKPCLPGAGRGPFPLRLAPVSLSRLVATDHSHRYIGWCGFYELLLSRRIVPLARKGGLLIDVGANAGYFSAIWASLRPENEVMAFEASPRNQALLAANLAHANFGDRVKMFGFAVGRSDGEMNFDLGPEEQTGWGGLALERNARSVSVPVKRLDTVLPPDVCVSVLKVDTEGADAWVLEGASGLLRSRSIQHIFCERNVTRMEALGIQDGEMERKLQDAGYIVEYLDGKRRTEIHAYLREK